jgi:hypothetical protein
MPKPVSVLVDNCITSLSDIMVPTGKEDEISWVGGTKKYTISGYIRKSPRNENEQWLQRQIDALPTIARLARDGGISCHTYSELEYEAMLRPGSFPANIIGDLFENVEFSRVNAPITRSRFFSGDERFVQREAVIDFCKWLHDPKVESLADRTDFQRLLPEFELNNLRHVGRFRDICQGLSKKQFPDAFHLWTAEVSGLDYFLSTDKKFIQAITKLDKTDLPCKPISPEDLLSELGVTERDPFPYEEGQFYNLFGMPD